MNLRQLAAVVMLSGCGVDIDGAASSRLQLATEAECSALADSASCSAGGCAWRRGDGEATATCHAASQETGTGSGSREGGDTGSREGADTGTKEGGDTGNGGTGG